jgi:hypothetical protein
MSCKPVEVVIPKGSYDTKIIQMNCGETDHHGMRVICDSCLNSRKAMSKIEQHQINVDADNAWLVI